MRRSTTLILLSLFVSILAATSAGLGLFYRAEGESFSHTTQRGQVVEIYGQDLYRFDTLDKVPTFRGADAVVLFAAVPSLLAALVFYPRGSRRVHLFLTGLLVIFLYHSVTVAFGVAYNLLFPLYTTYFSTSLFALLLAITSIRLDSLAKTISPQVPRRGIATFFFIAGMAVAFVWLAIIVEGLLRGEAPDVVAVYTTEVTFVIDLGITVPVTIIAAVFLLLRRPLAYILVPSLLMLYTFVGLLVAMQTVLAIGYGISLSQGEFIMFVGTFLLMSLVAAWLLVLFFRSVEADPSSNS